MIKLLQRNRFKKQYKKLHAPQKKVVNQSIQKLLEEPLLGEPKKGVLSSTRVLKFKLDHQLVLLAYEYDSQARVITLEALGSHENFYRDLER